MSTSELKKRLHEKINQVNDIDLLYALNVIISKQEAVYQIPDKYRENIDLGEKDIEEGRFYTLQDFEEKYKEWLKV